MTFRRCFSLKFGAAKGARDWRGRSGERAERNPEIISRINARVSGAPESPRFGRCLPSYIGFAAIPVAMAGGIRTALLVRTRFCQTVQSATLWQWFLNFLLWAFVGLANRPMIFEPFALTRIPPVYRTASHTPCPRSGGRVAEGGGLLNRYRGLNPYRGFESPPLRQ